MMNMYYHVHLCLGVEAIAQMANLKTMLGNPLQAVALTERAMPIARSFDEVIFYLMKHDHEYDDDDICMYTYVCMCVC